MGGGDGRIARRCAKPPTSSQAETERFFKAYQHHKARCNLITIRAVAEAAGLSPTTVQAIEKRRR